MTRAQVFFTDFLNSVSDIKPKPLGLLTQFFPLTCGTLFVIVSITRACYGNLVLPASRRPSARKLTCTANECC